MTKRILCCLPRIKIIESQEYLPTINTNVINILNTMRNGDIDKITGDAISQKKGLSLCITNFESLMMSTLPETALMLLNTLYLKFNNSDRKYPDINYSLLEYMKLRGIKDKKEARKQVERDLELLSRINIAYREESKKSNKKRNKNYLDTYIPLCSGKGIVDDVIIFQLSISFYNHLIDGFPMPINTSLFKTNPKTNAFFLGHRLHTHHNMNYNTSNAKVISVKALLEACPKLPKKEEASQELYKRIIIPFERGLEILLEKEILSNWEYCISKGGALTNDQLIKFNYKIFVTLSIKFELNNYPIRKNLKRKQKKVKT